MNDRIKDYFTFNRKEQRGLIALLGLMLFIVLAKMLLPVLIKDKEYDMSDFRQEAEIFLAEMAKADSLSNAPKQQPRKYEPTYFQRDTFHHYSEDKKYQKPVSAPDIVVIELNAADSASLLSLKGIGPYYAGKIIRYRNQLGGFYSGEQLLEIRGMDSLRLNGFKEQILIDSSLIKKIDINTITFKELLKHPYFEYYLVKAIFQKRDELKRFDSLEQLNEISVMYKELYDKIAAYLEVK